MSYKTNAFAKYNALTNTVYIAQNIIWKAVLFFRYST